MIITLFTSLLLAGASAAPVAPDLVYDPGSSDTDTDVGTGECTDGYCHIPDTEPSPAATATPSTASRMYGDDEGCIPSLGRRPKARPAVAVNGDDGGSTPDGPGSGRGNGDDCGPKHDDAVACYIHGDTDDTARPWMCVECEPQEQCNPWEPCGAWEQPGCDMPYGYGPYSRWRYCPGPV